MKCFIKVLCLIWIVLSQTECTANTGLVGTSNETEFTADTEPMLYLNTDSPAECDGSIISYRFCHYQTGTSNNNIARVGVYRLEMNDINYQLVEGTEMELRIGRNEPFSCQDTDPFDIPVNVLSGDVIGACVEDPNGAIVHLNIVGSTTDYALEGMLPATSCISSLPNTVGANQLGPISSRVLHVSADITPVTATTMPTMMPTSTMGGGDNSSIPGGGGGDNTGAVAGGVVVVVILLVAVIAALIIVVVVLVLKRKKGQFYGATKQRPSSVRGIENLVYETGGLGADPRLNESQPYEVPQALNIHYKNREISPYQVMGPTSSVSSRPGDSKSFSSVPTTLPAAGYHNVPGSFSSAVSYGSPATLPAHYEGMSFGGDVYCSPIDATRYSELIEQNKEEDIYSNVDPFQAPASEEDQIYSQLRSWGIVNLSDSEVSIESHLGSGQFGSVEQGVWKRQRTKPVDVALKSLTKTSDEDKVKFLQEAAIMAQFRHPNVIMLYGVIAKEDPMMLVVELAQKGDLREYLLTMKTHVKKDTDAQKSEGETKQLPPETAKTFVKFSQQVALGMQYLAGKGFVHRDLAARNILVTKKNICKVADFGMSRDLADESYYVSQGGKIPVKWTAPEAIHYKKYSTPSDVWAYGCLLYEIWSVGHKPFEGKRNGEAIEIVDAGKRLSPPPGCPKIIYELMILCWHPETVLRPAFRDIVLTLVGNEEMVLNIPEEDSSTNPLAGVLGAPLEAGENMYSELQRRYIDYAARKETDEDYFEID